MGVSSLAGNHASKSCFIAAVLLSAPDAMCVLCAPSGALGGAEPGRAGEHTYTEAWYRRFSWAWRLSHRSTYSGKVARQALSTLRSRLWRSFVAAFSICERSLLRFACSKRVFRTHSTSSLAWAILLRRSSSSRRFRCSSYSAMRSSESGFLWPVSE